MPSRWLGSIKEEGSGYSTPFWGQDGDRRGHVILSIVGLSKGEKVAACTWGTVVSSHLTLPEIDVRSVCNELDV